jgi:hypothetical protein
MNAWKLITCLLVLSLVGCGTFEVGIEHPIEVPTTLTAPTASLEALAATATQPPATATQPPTTVAEAASTQTQEQPSGGPQMVKIFLIAVGDQGQAGKPIGCGDSVVPVQVPIPPTLGVLKAALEALLSLKQQYYGESGLYNALYQSDLHLDSVVLTNGNAVVHLSGTLSMGGECDNPRIQAQLEETVLQFSTVHSVTIYINDRLLSDVISLKG